MGKKRELSLVERSQFLRQCTNTLHALSGHLICSRSKKQGWYVPHATTAMRGESGVLMAKPNPVSYDSEFVYMVSPR